MYDQAEWHQLMLERQQQTEEALLRAKQGTATEDDWRLIQHELGLGNDHLRTKQH